MQPARSKFSRAYFLFVVILGLLVFFSIHGALRPFENVILKTIFVPLFSASRLVTSAILSSFGWPAEYQRLSAAYNHLLLERTEIYLLRKENEALKAELRISESLGRRVVVVDNIGFGREAGSEIIFVNRGENLDIHVDDPVMTAENVYVGKVRRVGAYHAEVLLATSPSYSFDVIFPKNGARGRVRGAYGRELSVDFVSSDIKLEKGDFFIVSSKPGDRGANLIVGEAREVISGQAEVFQRIRAIHNFDPFSTSPLFVILGSSR